MQEQNLREYEGLRTELITLKNCITTYVGFVAAGSATAFWALAAIKTEGDGQKIAIGLASILLAITSTFVLLVLTYKFRSHNRYVGYSKLLTHERYQTKVATSIVGWEICVDRLRSTDFSAAGLIEYCRKTGLARGSLRELPSRIRQFCGPQPRADRHAMVLGLLFLLGQRRQPSMSWHFPVYVARIFAAINAAFLFFAAYFVVVHPANIRWGWIGIAATLVLALACLWLVFVKNLYRLMFGSETVKAYCWRFVVIRHCLLAELDPAVEYSLVGVGRVC
jgi:hypothetical protein